MKPIWFANHVSLQVIDEISSKEVLDFVIRNKDFLKPWEVERNADYYSIAYHESLLHDEYRKMQEGSLFKVWLFKDEAIIGSIALSNIVRGAFQSCHLGYRLDERELGKGIMTEALRVVIKYAFQELQLHRIEANIMPRNKASIGVVEKLGFEHEGIARKYLKINGAWEDHIHMVLLNEEMHRL
ncbi:GNAT family N-acetyltransferase [Paenibacillus sp. SC116]|uniref:GNAT family N-acetyltransferase n=1 Tax=Paenibacillus sp. SC116 TaxID=2968986 RepID=UPI00215AFA01|nr:GNAT family N-acetyltransferase [Paenibacillus sp. SC116]MCR8843318.1 GNAT family N-acetyltransferase [Paenibacillus sp. SC116]